MVVICPAQYFYLQDNDVNSIQLEYRGDLKLGYAFTPQKRENLQIGYSPIKHLSLSGGFFWTEDSRHPDSQKSFLVDGHSYTVAVGLYHNIEKPVLTKYVSYKKLQSVLIETYFGLSKGYLCNKHQRFEPEQINLNHQNFFFKWGLHLNYKTMGWSLTNKYNLIEFGKAEFIGNNEDITRAFNHFNNDIVQNNPRWITEFTMGFHINIKMIELSVNVNRMFTKGRPDLRKAFYKNSTLFFGLVFELDDWIKILKKR